MNLRDTFSRPSIRAFHDEYPQVTQSWLLIIIISFAVAILATTVSTETTRSTVIQSLLIGVVTLFSIIFTLTVMGIQVASNRYSHRVDSIVIQKIAFWIHFLPHLMAIYFGAMMLSIGVFTSFDFFWFIFFISSSLLSIFPFIQWLLNTLSPEMALSASLGQINSEFLSNVEEAVSAEKSKIMDGDDRDRLINIFREMSYLTISDDDPVDRSMDVLRSRILSNDTGTARTLIKRYSSHTESVIEHRYQEFPVSHSESQLVSWYLLGPLEDLFQLSVKEGNHRIAQEIISLQRKSIQAWIEKDVDEVPEVFFRIFSSISVDYLEHNNRSQAVDVAKQYGKIAGEIASDIDSSETNITGVNRSNFVSSCMAYAERSINQNYSKPATLIRTGLRGIVDAKLRNPPLNPDRELLMIGLIGEQLAAEGIVSKNIVGIANDTSIRNEAEWTITTLVTFKDKIEEQDDVNDKILEKVMDEIERVNQALEEKDREVVTEISYDNQLVIQVIRGSRLFRSPFSVEDLTGEMDISEPANKIERVCDELVGYGVLEDRENDKYMKAES